ncbi:tryptophan--tRNA ligase [Mycoplasmoides pirum]|uniref:tryptophan--tRNA ligase n=1 Tax=Mycoplasmoides pirum TaxID=2122 RepID=UPI000B2B12ED|nr:tryptophan--tRNA ligase [Mycoplasmoides pirum]
MKLKRIVSGIQSSGRLHLGNYLGSISNFAKLQNEYEMFLFVADLHAITVDFDPSSISNNKLDIVTTYLASSINPQKVNIFIQSEVLEHTALSYILMCHTNLGELERMTQYKAKISDQSLKQDNNTLRIPTGLLIYPTLMAADILLYQSNLVPVGADQKQHIELTRDIAIRFNAKYGDTFQVPEPWIPKIGNRIMDLTDATKKMSKSSKSHKGVIFLDESIDSIKQKIKSAKTDSLDQVKFNPTNQPNITNLINIYISSINDPINFNLRKKLFNVNNEIVYQDVEQKYKNQDYRNFKNDLTEIVVGLVLEIQKNKNKYKDIKVLNQILNEGKLKAQAIAKQTLEIVYEKIGFTIK